MVLAGLCIAALAGRDDWAVDDVAWIITAEERRAWQTLRDDTARNQFIEGFWLRRDPTPDTLENEFRDKHYWRLSNARRRFPPGSDEERTFVVLGPPDRIEEDGNIRRKWSYSWIEGIGHGIDIQFVRSNGAFRLTHDADAALFGPFAPVEPNLFERLSRTARKRSEPRLLRDDRCGSPITSLTVKARPVTGLIGLVEVTATLPFQCKVMGRVEGLDGVIVTDWYSLHRGLSGPVYTRRVALEKGIYWLTLVANDESPGARYRQTYLLKVE